VTVTTATNNTLTLRRDGSDILYQWNPTTKMLTRSDAGNKAYISFVPVKLEGFNTGVTGSRFLTVMVKGEYTDWVNTTISIKRIPT
jgi:hypothetical protein